jgi:hypothetical protein
MEIVNIRINFKPMGSTLPLKDWLVCGGQKIENISCIVGPNNLTYSCSLPAATITYEDYMNRTEKTLLKDLPTKIETVEFEKKRLKLLDCADKILPSQVEAFEAIVNSFITDSLQIKGNTQMIQAFGNELNLKIRRNNNFVKLFAKDGTDTNELGGFFVYSGGKIVHDSSFTLPAKAALQVDISVEFFIAIYGYCITAVAASRFAQKLRGSLRGKNVRIKIVCCDPYSGPISKKEGGNIRVDLEDKKDDIKFAESVVVYSMGGGFFTKNSKLRIFNRAVCFTPQVVNGATHIIIVPENHNDINGWQLFQEEINKRQQGVYIWPGTDEMYPITTDNLNEAIQKIYDFSKGREKERITILTNIIARKLKLAPDELVPYLPNYKKTFEDIMTSIKKALIIRYAFQMVFNLFAPKGLFWGFVNEKGDFYQALKNAQKCVVGIRNNNFENAIAILECEKNATKYKYKKAICQALIERIKRWYNLG